MAEEVVKAENPEKAEKKINLDLETAYSYFNIPKELLDDPKKFHPDLFWGPVKKALKSKDVKGLDDSKKRGLLKLLVEHFRDLNKKHVIDPKDRILEVKNKIKDLNNTYKHYADSFEKISREPNSSEALAEFLKKENVHSLPDFLKKIPKWDGFSYQFVPTQARGFGDFRELKPMEELFSAISSKSKDIGPALKPVVKFLRDVNKKAESDFKSLETILSEGRKPRSDTKTLISIPAVEDSVQDLQLVNRAFKRNVLLKDLASTKEVDVSGGDPLFKGTVESVLDSLLTALPEKQKGQAIKEDIRSQELQFVYVNEMLDTLKEATAHISDASFKKVFDEIDKVSEGVSEIEDISSIVDKYSSEIEKISNRHKQDALEWIFKVNLNKMEPNRGVEPPAGIYNNEKEKSLIIEDAAKVDEFLSKVGDVKSSIEEISNKLKNVLDEGVYSKVFAPMRKFINFYNRVKEKNWFKRMLRGDFYFVKEPSNKEAASKTVDLVSALKDSLDSFKDKLSKYQEFIEDSGILDMINRLKKSTHFKEEDYPDKEKLYVDVRKLLSDKFTPKEFEEFVDMSSKLTSKADIVGNFNKKMDSFILKAVSSVFPQEVLGKITHTKLKEKEKEEEEQKKEVEEMTDKEERKLLSEPKEASIALRLAVQYLSQYDSMPRLLIAKKLRELSSAIDVLEIEKKRDKERTKGDSEAPSKKDPSVKFDREHKIDFFQKLRSFKDRPSMFRKNGMTFGVFTDMFDHSTNDDEFLREWFDKSPEGTLDPKVYEEISDRWAKLYLDKMIKREFSSENINKKLQEESRKIEDLRENQKKAFDFIKELKSSFAPFIIKLSEIDDSIKGQVNLIRENMKSKNASSMVPDSFILEDLGIVKIGSFEYEGKTINLFKDAKKHTDPYGKDESRPEENVPDKEEDEPSDKQSPQQKKKEIYNKIFPGKRKLTLPDRGKNPLEKLYYDIKDKFKELGSKIKLQEKIEKLKRIPDENDEVSQFLDAEGLEKEYLKVIEAYNKVLELYQPKVTVHGEGSLRDFTTTYREIPEIIERFTNIYSTFVNKYKKKLEDYRSKIIDLEEGKQDLEEIKEKGLDPARVENFKKLYMAFMWRRIERLWSSNLVKFQSYFNVNFESFQEVHDMAKKLFGEGMASRLGNLVKDIEDMVRGRKVPSKLIKPLKQELAKIKSLMYDAWKDKTKAVAVAAVHEAVKDEDVTDNFGVDKPKDPKDLDNKAETKIKPVVTDLEERKKELAGKYGALKKAYVEDKDFNIKVLHGSLLQRKISELLEKELV